MTDINRSSGIFVDDSGVVSQKSRPNNLAILRYELGSVSFKGSKIFTILGDPSVYQGRPELIFKRQQTIIGVRNADNLQRGGINIQSQ